MSEVMGSHSWAKQVIEHYRDGYSDKEVAASMNITFREFNAMLSDNPTFAKLVEFGRTLSAAYWEGLARTNIKNKTFNTPLYNFYMKNKFGWADKIETTNANENTNLSLDQLQDKINQQLKKLKGADISVPDSVFVQEPVKEDAEDA